MHKRSARDGRVPPSRRAPAGVAPPRPAIDRVHLFRMTLGDTALQHEVLDLFDQQIALLTARMHDAPPAAVATLAHTLKGSARGVGAFGLVEAAEAVEAAVADGRDLGVLLAALEAAGQGVRAAIAEMRQNEAGAADIL